MSEIVIKTKTMTKFTVKIPDAFGRKRRYHYWKVSCKGVVKTFPFNNIGKEMALQFMAQTKQEQWKRDFRLLLAAGETMFPDRPGFNHTVSSLLRKREKTLFKNVNNPINK